MFLPKFNVYVKPTYWARASYHICFWRPVADCLTRDAVEVIAEFTTKEVPGYSDDFTGQSLQIEEGTAQHLMDELWKCGLRPTEGTGSAGSLKATQDHLKDMQALTLRNLGIVEHLLGRKE